MLISYTEKYDLFSDVRLIESDMKLKKRIADHPSIRTVVNALSEELENIVPWESITVVLYDEGQRAWGVASVRVRGNDRFVSPKQLIDFENSIVGHCIRSNSVQSVDLKQNASMIFNEHERASDVLKQGMMVVAPVSSGGKCYGAVVVTERKQNAYSKKDIAAIQFLASTIAPEFEITELNSILNEHIAVDELTGTLTKKFFHSRLLEELARATEREEDLSLVLVTMYNVADIQQRYDNDGKDAALVHVARHLRASVRPYDIVARFDATTFAVVLADTIANDAFLWAEKLRMAIAGSIVNAGRKSFSISVTIGVSGASAKMSGDELVRNVSHVLDLAKKAGGNIVRVF
jgi:diguanylate cyclase (GGDEF)-like protein